MGLSGKLFAECSEEERIALTDTAFREGRTLLKERWEGLSSQEAESWHRRTEAAARLLANEIAVVDLGCGTMTLERYLAADVRYVPVDVARRDERTIIYDINSSHKLPSFDATAVACLGLLEYIIDVPKLMQSLTANFKLCVVSYCIVDAPKALVPRRGHGWFNDYARDQIEAIFREAGWGVRFFDIVGGRQALWRLDRDSFR